MVIASDLGTVVPNSDYTVVHLVMQEVAKDLIGPQVVDHMVWQHTAPGRGRPNGVAVGFLEPVRAAIGAPVRRRLRTLRARSPELALRVMPYVSRLGIMRNAAWHAHVIRRRTRGRPVVFHCRGESAADWGLELATRLPGSGVVADIRGAWPEELLFARGYEDPDVADPSTRADYKRALHRLQRVLGAAGAVLSVSRGMLDWLCSTGAAEESLAYVPCCVSQLQFSPASRARIRQQLALGDKLVLAYLGTITRYQHIEDGLLPFFRVAAERCTAAHLLCLTNDVERMNTLIAAAGISPTRATVLRVPQNETTSYLSAADAGFLLRAPSRINRYSQPTKLGEYLASGLPVIVSRGTGCVGSLMEQSGAGVSVECFGMDERARAREAGAVCARLLEAGAAMRDRALALCEREFLWSTYTDVVRQAYLRALRAGSPS